MDKGCYNCRWCNVKDTEEPCIECQGENWESQKRMPREKIILFCLILAMVVLVGVLANQQVRIEDPQSEPALSVRGPITTKGDFTLMHYADGWVNYFYITEFYLDGQVLYYAIGDSPQFIPVALDRACIVPGWIPEEELAGYGYWTPEDLGLEDLGL